MFLIFCFSGGFIAMESLKIMQKSFGESILSEVLELYKVFIFSVCGREVIEILPHASRLSTSFNYSA